MDEKKMARAEVNVENYSKYGAKKKYAYAFIEAFLKNSSKFGDDGKARDQMAPKSAHGTSRIAIHHNAFHLRKSSCQPFDQALPLPFSGHKMI